MNDALSPAPTAPTQTLSAGQPWLALMARGQGQSAAGGTVDSPTGFALWFEGVSQCVTLSGHKQAQIVYSQGSPYVDIFHMERMEGDEPVPTKELRVPCVDLIGLAALGEGLEAYRDELAHERTNRSLH